MALPTGVFTRDTPVRAPVREQVGYTRTIRGAKMNMPEGKERNNGTGERQELPPDTGFPGTYGRFGDHPEEVKLPQLSILPGMIATILWVAVMLWLASLPGGPLHLPAKPTAAMDKPLPAE